MRNIKNILENIDNWSLPTHEELSAYISKLTQPDRPPANKTGRHWSCTEIINPLEMYTYLKARFGEANGLAMIVKERDTADNLIQWDYHLIYGNHALLFTGFNYHFDILISNISDRSDDDKQVFLKSIRKDFQKYEAKIAAVKEKLEKWKLFINPFYHLSVMVDENYELLKNVEITKPLSRRPQDLNIEQMKNSTKNVHLAFSIGTTLKLTIPIWIESFINLVIFMSAKKELKNDPSQFQSFNRLPIFEKIKKLDQNCDGFLVGFKDEELNQLSKIFHNRNRILHGGIDPSSGSNQNIYFDNRYIPLYDCYTYPPHLLQGVLLDEVNLDTIQKEITIGENFFTLLVSKLTNQTAYELIELMNENIPAWDDRQKRLGRILPAQFIDTYPSMSDNN